MIGVEEVGGGVSGFVAIGRLRRERGAPVPAILITGHDGLGETVGDEVPVLAKPVRPAELRAAIASQWLDHAP
jgi:CheY-like chemotaxis protein